MTKKDSVVIKLGGELLRPGALRSIFYEDLKSLSKLHHLVIVHGGGPQMNEEAARRGHRPEIKFGRRVTKDVDLDILNEVLGQRLNRELVDKLQMYGLEAIGLKGSDAVVMVTKRPPVLMEGEWIDFGWVGDVERINSQELLKQASTGIPVLATMGCDNSGQVFNVNGDTVAAEIAHALHASKLFYLTGVGQVLDGKDRALKICDSTTFERGRDEGWINGGMRVKVETGLALLHRGHVGEVSICDQHSLSSGLKMTKLLSSRHS